MTDHAKRTMDKAATDALFAAASDALPQEIRKADLMATVRRIHFDAYLKKGFTHDQALDLCKDSVKP